MRFVSTNQGFDFYLGRLVEGDGTLVSLILNIRNDFVHLQTAQIIGGSAFFNPFVYISGFETPELSYLGGGLPR